MAEVLPSPLTVGELIERLSSLPRELPVMINGYEYGYDYPLTIHVQCVRQERDDESYGGRFDEASEVDENRFDVLLISRQKQ